MTEEMKQRLTNDVTNNDVVLYMKGTKDFPMCGFSARAANVLKAAKVEQVSPGRLRFVLREGRNRQIRRMCELVGLVVVDLFRVRIGPLELSSLPEGKWRALTSEERAALIKASAFLPGASGGSTARKASARSRGKSRSGPARAGQSRKR